MARGHPRRKTARTPQPLATPASSAPLAENKKHEKMQTRATKLPRLLHARCAQSRHCSAKRRLRKLMTLHASTIRGHAASFFLFFRAHVPEKITGKRLRLLGHKAFEVKYSLPSCSAIDHQKLDFSEITPRFCKPGKSSKVRGRAISMIFQYLDFTKSW